MCAISLNMSASLNPGGDVPSDTGVCTDEIIRSYRAVGVDLQKEIHEDMVRNFSAYPDQKRWRLSHPDSNIDHRRVPNLMVFFARKGKSLPITNRASDYAPGDLVTWDLGRKQRTVHGGSQHWRGTADGRCSFQLEDHRPLPLFWARKLGSRG